MTAPLLAQQGCLEGLPLHHDLCTHECTLQSARATVLVICPCITSEHVNRLLDRLLLADTQRPEHFDSKSVFPISLCSRSDSWPGMLILHLHGCRIELGRAVDAIASAICIRGSRHAAGARHEILRARARLQCLLPNYIRLGSRSACPRCLP